MNLEQLSTEQSYEQSQNLDALNALEIVKLMNSADAAVPLAVREVLPQVAQAVDAITARLQKGGRVIYVGAGTSGRIGFMDASECPPTFGTPPEMIQSLMAGGTAAVFQAAENVEDDEAAAVSALQKVGIRGEDTVVGLSASGRTPYTARAVRYARLRGALTVGVTCNPASDIGKLADIAIEVDTGPEVLMGSTRLKAGTAQKLVLNMLSTAVMVRMNRVYRNLMVDLKATNNKLKERSKRIIMLATGVTHVEAENALDAATGSVKLAILMLHKGVSKEIGIQLLQATKGNLREAIACPQRGADE